MATSLRTIAAASVLLSITATGFAESPKPFGAVKDGVLGVYAIDDFTTFVPDEGSQSVDTSVSPAKAAEEIGALIRSVLCVGQWTDDGGDKAAMVVTPKRITVKASADVQRQISFLLVKLHEQRELFIRSEYRVVESPDLRDLFTTIKSGSPFVILEESATAAIVANAKTILAASTQTVQNGVDRIWIDDTGGTLPVLRASAVLSADRKYVTLALNSTGGDRGRDIKNLQISVPSGRTAAVPLDEQHTRWLVFKPEALRVIFKAAGQ